MVAVFAAARLCRGTMVREHLLRRLSEKKNSVLHWTAWGVLCDDGDRSGEPQDTRESFALSIVFESDTGNVP